MVAGDDAHHFRLKGEFGWVFPALFRSKDPHIAIFRRLFAFAVAASSGLSDAV